MGLIARMLRETVVYWPPTGPDQFGILGFGTAVELPGRWEDATEEFIDANGTRTMSKARVYVGEDVLVGGFLWRGDLSSGSDITSTTDPRLNPGAWEIRKFDKLPKLHFVPADLLDPTSDKFLRTVLL